jgi:hypothetical protein
MLRHISPLKNNSKNSSSMSHHLKPHHLSILEIILKIQENHLMSHQISLLTNNSENLSCMPHHPMPCHIFPLKDNSEK